MNNFFYSMISFIIAVFFILLGIIGVIIPWSLGVRTSLVQFILDDSLAISLFGFTSIVVGLAIAVNILISTRRHYYHTSSKGNEISVDETVIQQYLSTYWTDLFPGSDIPCRLLINNNKIYITVDFPPLPLSQQQILLERIKQELTNTFAGKLGYHNEFYLSASFQAKSKNKI